MKTNLVWLCLFLSPAFVTAAEPQAAQAPDYAKDVAPLFRKYCIGCHNAGDAFTAGELMLESFPKLMKGSENGKVVVPGDPEKSKLVLVLEKKAEPFMPPEGNEGPAPEEIQLLRAWIKAGAKGPAAGEPDPHKLVTPKIDPAGPVRKPVAAADHSPDGNWIAAARYGTVEILAAEDRKPVKELSGHSGNVNDLRFSRDGKILCVAAGEAGLFGEVTLWETADWNRKKVIRGHSDSLYAAELSPDGGILATGSYDQKIMLWNAETGEALHELTGHNGTVFDLAFHPAGRVLASASGDRTVKLWDVDAGDRLETLGEPEKEQYALAFSPDGRFVVSGGVDNRIRVWEIRTSGEKGNSPLLYSRFAHEASIINLEFSADGEYLVTSGEDRAVKIWETEEFTPRHVLSEQPDWASALSVTPDNRSLLVGRMDGTLAAYKLDSGEEELTAETEPVTRPPLPEPHAGDPVAQIPQGTEIEPNSVPAQAMAMPAPATVHGVLWRGLTAPVDAPPDVDVYHFPSRAGQTWVLETNAARSKSPADTKIEVLHADGTPVLRYLLQAVRDSAITFRPIDSAQEQARLTNWEEMKLNQFVYMSGEVCKLFRHPQGPDSGFLFYSNKGKRRCYFNTSPTVHALDEPVYIVEAYPPGTELADNGLPVFPLYYGNDDDGERELGTDSRLMFTAPDDGTYLVRVSDVRGFGGREFKYTLTIREPKPDFNVSIAGKGSTIGAGGGQRLIVTADRIDGFDGEIRVDISGMPEGLQVSSPIEIEAGHLEARGVINVDSDVEPNLVPAAKPKTGRPAPPPLPEPLYLFDWSKLQITATAVIHGEEVVKDLGDLGMINVSPQPNVIVQLNRDLAAAPSGAPSDELVIRPGETISALLSIERNGFDGELRFDVENLPHGVIVDNLGLNGIMVREGETQRQIFISAEEWVPESTRWIHAVSRAAGNQTSRPIRFHVRKRALQAKR